MTYDIPGWSGPDARQRTDGLRVHPTVDDLYFFVPDSPSTKAINDCPCCGSRLRTVRAAQLACEITYPLEFAYPLETKQ